MFEKSEIRVELHTHTKYSHDSMLGKWVYLLALKYKKINYIAICDHNQIKGALSYKKFLKKFGIDVIVGEEIFTKNGEIIGLFLKEKIKPYMSVEETIKEIKRQNGIVYVPHPYDEKRYKTVLPLELIKENSMEIEVMEIHNGRNSKDYFSIKQEEIANKFPNIIKVIGSDAHCFFELGRNYLEMEKFTDKDDFLIKLSTSKFYRKKGLNIAHTITKFVRVYKMILRREFNELFRVINRRFKKRN
ncbi:MAG: PHP domain-containing protein [Solibacillus sp.]